jgi:hypothetical protein
VCQLAGIAIEQHEFSTFFRVDDAFAVIDKLWREAMEKSYKTAEQYLKTAEKSAEEAKGRSNGSSDNTATGLLGNANDVAQPSPRRDIAQSIMGMIGLSSPSLTGNMSAPGALYASPSSRLQQHQQASQQVLSHRSSPNLIGSRSSQDSLNSSSSSSSSTETDLSASPSIARNPSDPSYTASFGTPPAPSTTTTRNSLDSPRASPLANTRALSSGKAVFSARKNQIHQRRFRLPASEMLFESSPFSCRLWRRDKYFEVYRTMQHCAIVQRIDMQRVLLHRA